MLRTQLQPAVLLEYMKGALKLGRRNFHEVTRPASTGTGTWNAARRSRRIAGRPSRDGSIKCIRRICGQDRPWRTVDRRVLTRSISIRFFLFNLNAQVPRGISVFFLLWFCFHAEHLGRRLFCFVFFLVWLINFHLIQTEEYGRRVHRTALLSNRICISNICKLANEFCVKPIR